MSTPDTKQQQAGTKEAPSGQPEKSADGGSQTAGEQELEGRVERVEQAVERLGERVEGIDEGVRELLARLPAPAGPSAEQASRSTAQEAETETEAEPEPARLPREFAARAAVSESGDSYEITVEGPIDETSHLLLERDGQREEVKAARSPKRLHYVQALAQGTEGTWTAYLQHRGAEYRIDTTELLG
jgi:hypothetical protein